MKDVEISGNTVRHQPGGRRCPSGVGALLRDSPELAVTDNVFAGATQAVDKDARSTGVSDRDNRPQG